LNAAFAESLKEFAAAECRAVEIWLTALEDYLGSHSAADVRRLLEERQLVVAATSQQGGVLSSQGEARRAAWELLQRRLHLTNELAGKTLVMACDVSGPLVEQDLERVRVSLVQVAQTAAQHAVRVAIEFQARSALGNNLQTAAALVSEVASPYLGLCFDAFHYYVGPSKPDDLGLLTRDNLFHVQLCDLADVPREFATDAQRILPGEGDIPLQPVIARLAEIGYEGYVSIELMNPRIWQIPPRQFGEVALAALRKILPSGSNECD
jgi:4-hydroxyphenylpyruvate dioxygenase